MTQQVSKAGIEVSFLEASSNRSDGEKTELTHRDQQLAQRFVWLFRDSFQATVRQQEQAMTSRGDQQKWRPVLRDAHGKVVHSPGNVLLNPLPQLAGSNVPNSRPLVQLVLPTKARIDPGPYRPVAYLVCESQPDHQQQATRLFNTFLSDRNQGNGHLVQEAMAQYRLVHATIDPARPQDFRRGMEAIVSLTTGQHGKEANLLVDQLLHIHPLYRITHHPDVGAVGRQRIEQTTIPLAYKGVSLQPAQIRNLLLGNTIEVAGIRDPRRGSLYRAGVSFNILSGNPDEVSRREQLKTDNRQEAVTHRRLVGQQDDDRLRRSQVHTDNALGSASVNVTARSPRPSQA